MVVAVLLTWVGSMAQTREKVRLGVGAGVNMTSGYYSGSRMQPGGELYGLMNIGLGDGGWMAEGRLGLSLDRWKDYGNYDSDLGPGYPGAKAARIAHYRLGLKLPVMIGRNYETGNNVGIYWLIGPSVSYSPLQQDKLGEKWHDLNAYSWLMWGNARVGVEIGERHKIEAAYSINITRMNECDDERQHIVGISYAYVF